MGANSAASKARCETLLNASDVSSWTTTKPLDRFLADVISLKVCTLLKHPDSWTYIYSWNKILSQIEVVFSIFSV